MRLARLQESGEVRPRGDRAMLKFGLAMALWVLGEGGPGQMTLVSMPKLEGRGCTCVCVVVVHRAGPR